MSSHAIPRPPESHTQTQAQDNNSLVHIDSTSSRSSSPRRSHSYSPARLLGHVSPPVTLVLDNVGSVARDHLANERTWLAYIRTSLGIAGTGVALVQLFTISQKSSPNQDNSPGRNTQLERYARPLGATTVFVAISVLAIGVFRFFRVQQAMTNGKFPVARTTVVMISAVLAALVAVIFGILVALPKQ